MVYCYLESLLLIQSISDCDIKIEYPPIINIGPLIANDNNNQQGKARVIAEIGTACVDWGFFHIINHSIPMSLMEQTQIEMKKFFKLPIEEKLKLKRTVNNSRGFADDELTKQKKDWKEIFDFGSDFEDDPTNNHNNNILDGRNQWPNQDILPRFKSIMKEYYRFNAILAQVIMDAISESIGADTQYLRNAFANHTSFARLNYYPKLQTIAKIEEQYPLGISRHTDAGGLTILWQDSPGLQVYSGTKQDRNDGKWVNVSPVSPKALTINIGDMVHVWTGGKCQAPEHRVIANANNERFSIPFFYNPSYDTIIRPLPIIDSSRFDSFTPTQYRPFTWGEFRRARFAGDYADLGKETQIEDWEINNKAPE